MLLEDSTNTENYEIEEIAKSLCCLYEVNSWVAVAFGKTWYPGDVNQLMMTKLKFCVKKGLVEHQTSLCDQRMKI